MNKSRDYDSTVARMAGNIAAGLVSVRGMSHEEAARQAVRVARLILAEIKQTEPQTADVNQ